MKKLRRALAFLLALFPAMASETKVQSTSPATSVCGSTSGVHCTFSPSATGAGNTLVAYIYWNNTGSPTVTVPTGWTADSSSLISTGARATQFFYLTNAASTSSVQFTISASNAFRNGIFYEISSTVGAGWPKYDTSNQLASSTSGTTNTGPTLTLNGSDDFILQGLETGTTISSVSGGYNLVSCGVGCGTAWLNNLSSDGAMTWTDGGTTTTWNMSAIAFCDAGSGACSSSASSPVGFPLILEFFDRRVLNPIAHLLLPWAPRGDRMRVRAFL